MADDEEEKKRIIEEMGLEAIKVSGKLRGFAKEKDSYSGNEVSEFLRVYRNYLVQAKDYAKRNNKYDNRYDLLQSIVSLRKTIPRGLVNGSNQSFSDILDLEERVQEELNSHKKSKKSAQSG